VVDVDQDLRSNNSRPLLRFREHRFGNQQLRTRRDCRLETALHTCDSRLTSIFNLLSDPLSTGQADDRAKGRLRLGRVSQLVGLGSLDKVLHELFVDRRVHVDTFDRAAWT